MNTNMFVRFVLVVLVATISAGCASSAGSRRPLSPEEAAAMRRANEPGAQTAAATQAFVRQGEEICGTFSGEQRVQMDSRASQDSGVGGRYNVRSAVSTRCGRKFGGNSE